MRFIWYFTQLTDILLIFKTSTIFVGTEDT